MALIFLITCATAGVAAAQQTKGHGLQSQFEAHLACGELSLASQLLEQVDDRGLRDQLLGRLASAQRLAGLSGQSMETTARIWGDNQRLDTLARISPFSGSGGGSGGDDGLNDGFGGGFRNPAGGRGGITEADFNDLIELIQETIDPDSWEENGGTGRMRAFPSGVMVDAGGRLRNLAEVTDPVLDERLRSVDVVGLAELHGSADLRAISLTRLEREIQARAARGLAPTPEMMCLGGIYRLTHLMIYPDTRDIVIAGPSGPWVYDNDGRAINQETGTPVLNLDDLVVCLRNAKRSGGQFWCSIDPDPENLARVQSFIQTTKLRGKELKNQIVDILGDQKVTVDGIDPSTHAGHVIVEADYHMKLIGMGVVDSIPAVRNYFQRMQLDANGRAMVTDSLVRWWFTMNYDAIATNPDRTVFSFQGDGVRLMSESEFWNERGEREHTGQSSPAASGFADDFTRNFEAMAQRYPVYGELRNLFDCALAANVIVREGMARNLDWQLDHFDRSSHPGMPAWQSPVEHTPVSVPSVAGQRQLRFREGARVVTQEITNVSGGVEFFPDEWIGDGKVVADETAELDDLYRSTAPETTPSWTWVGAVAIPD